MDGGSASFFVKPHLEKLYIANRGMTDFDGSYFMYFNKLRAVYWIARLNWIVHLDLP